MRDVLRSNPLFGARQPSICLAATLIVLTTDALFPYTRSTQTAAEFTVELAIHTLGLCDGSTIITLFNLTEARQKNGDGSKRG